MPPLPLRICAAATLAALGAAALRAGPVEARARELVALDRRIEDAVVRMDFGFLQSVYGEDFVFSHGGGDVQDRKTWLAIVARGYFRERKVVADEAEVHGDTALTVGRLAVHEVKPGQDKHYGIRYVRLYVRRDGGWRLVSHRTTEFKMDP